jgi:hypothetical protein
MAVVEGTRIAERALPGRFAMGRPLQMAVVERRRIAEHRDAVAVCVDKVLDGLEADLDGTAIEWRVLAQLKASPLRLSPEMERAARRAVVAIVRDALARLRSEAGLPQELPADLIRLASLWAKSSYELAHFADVQLAGQEVFWDWFSGFAERVLADTSLRWEVVKAARARLTGHTARLGELFRRAYELELARLSAARDGSPWAAVARALKGQWVDAAELGYDLSWEHVAVVANTAGSLEAIARRAGRDLLEVQVYGGGAWGWLGGDGRISDVDLDALVAWQRRREGQVAFGEPAVGIVGFSESHKQALEARAIALATGELAVRFADLHLYVALLRDRGLAQRFVARELRELAGPGERMHELRATLHAYLENGQCVSATAALLRRDRKTIQRQLHFAEQLLNHCLRDRSGELLIALRAADILQLAG